MDVLGGMIGQPGQHVGNPSLRIVVVELAGSDEGVDRSRTPSSDPAEVQFVCLTVTARRSHSAALLKGMMLSTPRFRVSLPRPG